MPKLSVRDLDLKNKCVFLRVDFNVPLAPGGQEITSDKRIKASLATIRYALEQGAGLILASHLGRPKGKPNPEMSLKPVAKRLEELLGRPVKMAPDCIGPDVEAMKPAPGEILLLENLRFHPEEEKNDPEFSKKLAALCDVYVNDAFGSAHRAHASTVGMIAYVPQAAAGLLMDQELKYLTMATRNPARPCVAILGGAKVSDKIEVIANLGKVVDKLLIGGAMAYTFMKAQGEPVGKSLVEDDKLDLARNLLLSLKDKLVLPVDHVVVSEIKENADSQVVDTIPDGMISERQAGAARGSRGGFRDQGERRQPGRRYHSGRHDRRGHRTADHRSLFARDPECQDRDLEWPDGRVREEAVRPRHGRPGKGGGRVGRDIGSGRRRFGKGHQERGRGRPDLAHLPRRRRVAGVSGRN